MRRMYSENQIEQIAQNKAGDVFDDKIENAESGTIADALGLDSEGNLVKGSVGGGTQLYKHTISANITYSYADNSYTRNVLIVFINNNQNAVSRTTLFTNAYIRTILFGSLGVPFQGDDFLVYGSFIFTDSDEVNKLECSYNSGHETNYYISNNAFCSAGEDGAITGEISSWNSFTDNVVPL